MLKKENRLRKDRDFQKVFKGSRPVFVKNLSVRATTRAGNDLPARFGFVISNKIDKRSSRRNSLKRRLRVAARELGTQIKPNMDIVVIVKSNFDYPYQLEQVREQLRKALLIAKVLK